MVFIRARTFAPRARGLPTCRLHRWRQYVITSRDVGEEIQQLARAKSITIPGDDLLEFTYLLADAMPEADRSTLARPGDVAKKLVAIIFERAFENGARLSLGGGS